VIGARHRHLILEICHLLVANGFVCDVDLFGLHAGDLQVVFDLVHGLAIVMLGIETVAKL